MKPNFWNRIFHYKRWKPLYFVRGFWRYYVTAGWANRRLNALLSEARQRPDWDYIRSRVEQSDECAWCFDESNQEIV